MHFGEASGDILQIVAEFTEWLTNERPQWAAYRAIMSSYLIGLEKNPRLCLVGVGETRRQMMVTCVIKMVGKEAKEPCRIDQLYGGG